MEINDYKKIVEDLYNAGKINVDCIEKRREYVFDGYKVTVTERNVENVFLVTVTNDSRYIVYAEVIFDIARIRNSVVKELESGVCTMNLQKAWAHFNDCKTARYNKYPAKAYLYDDADALTWYRIKCAIMDADASVAPTYVINALASLIHVTYDEMDEQCKGYSRTIPVEKYNYFEKTYFCPLIGSECVKEHCVMFKNRRCKLAEDDSSTIIKNYILTKEKNLREYNECMGYIGPYD